MTTWNHAYNVCFTIERSSTKDGSEVTAQQAREAIKQRFDAMSDDSLLEHMGAPFDSYEESN